MKWILFVLLCLCLPVPVAASPTLSYGPFGDLIIRGPRANPAHVAIVLSSARGWGAVEEQIAATLAADDVMTIGVDTGHYLREVNADPDNQNISDDLEYLNKYVQKNLGLSRLIVPLLIGHADGAAMVYANLVQAPEHTFRGGVSIAFRPTLGLVTPFTEGRGLTWRMLDKGLEFLPTTAFTLPWTVIQSDADQDYSWSRVQGFAGSIPGVTLVATHGAYADPATWSAPLRAAVAKYTEQQSSARDRELADLPLHPIPATGSPSDTMAVIISGDGGWAGLDKDVADTLAARGVDVVGLDSLRYFWKHRTPEEGGQDLTRILTTFMDKWHKDKAILIGYSLGADALAPFLLHVPGELRAKIRVAALLAPGKNAELEFHVTDWLGSDDENLGFPLLPEVRKLRDVPLLCLYGQEEENSLCAEFTPRDGVAESMPGSHHFDGDYAGLAERILRHAGLSAPAAPQP